MRSIQTEKSVTFPFPRRFSSLVLCIGLEIMVAIESTNDICMSITCTCNLLSDSYLPQDDVGSLSFHGGYRSVTSRTNFCYPSRSKFSFSIQFVYIR